MIWAWSFPITGMSLGMSAAASPGPYQAYVIGLVLRSGWRRALPAAFAPLITEGPIIALVLLLLTRVPAEFLRAVQIAGGVFVLYLAYKTVQAYRQFQPDAVIPSSETRRGFWQAVMMNFLSPGPYLFWSLLAGPTLIEGWNQSPVLGLAFMGGFYLALIGGMLLLIFVFGAARNLGPRVSRAMLGLSAIALLGFGAYQLWQGLLAYN
jgi:threonine/homoserine/homoserine lactone efflux protein